MSIKDIASLKLPGQMRKDAAKREKERRKRLGITQAELAEKSGVSLGSIRRFEQTGHISFDSLIALAYALGNQHELEGLFSKPAYRSIEEVMRDAAKSTS